MLRALDLKLGERLCGITAGFGPGRVTAICGPNGAGKSTLLQCLAGLLTPTAGSVELDGGALSRLHPQERAKAIGYLPQDPVVAWDVAVRDLVALGRMPHDGRGATVIARVIEQLDLQHLANRPVSQLSGGERARALLARVLAGEPQWILADEPFTALDLAHQAALTRHLRAAAASGAGVVLVLHDLALAMNHADRVLVLDEGKIAAEGAPEVALSPEVIAQVWGVDARWLGEPGARALSLP